MYSSSLTFRYVLNKEQTNSVDKKRKETRFWYIIYLNLKENKNIALEKDCF